MIKKYLFIMLYATSSCITSYDDQEICPSINKTLHQLKTIYLQTQSTPKDHADDDIEHTLLTIHSLFAQLRACQINIKKEIALMTDDNQLKAILEIIYFRLYTCKQTIKNNEINTLHKALYISGIIDQINLLLNYYQIFAQDYDPSFIDEITFTFEKIAGALVMQEL